MKLDLYIKEAIELKEGKDIKDVQAHVIKNGINLFYLIYEIGPYHINDIKSKHCQQIILVLNLVMIKDYDDAADLLASYNVNKLWLTKVCRSKLVPKKSTLHHIIKEANIHPGYIFDKASTPWL